MWTFTAYLSSLEMISSSILPKNFMCGRRISARFQILVAFSYSSGRMGRLYWRAISFLDGFFPGMYCDTTVFSVWLMLRFSLRRVPLWNFFRHTGHCGSCSFLSSFMMQSIQKEWPHGMVVGSWKMSRHSGQWNSSVLIFLVFFIIFFVGRGGGR